MLNDDLIKYRLESLKLSYEINLDIGNIKKSYENQQDIDDDLGDVLILSDIILEYVIYGKNVFEEEKDDHELVS